MYERIRNLREDRDLSQSRLAEILGMSQTGYSKYETGENDLPTAILAALAGYYDTSIDYLLNLTDEKKPYPRKETKKKYKGGPPYGLPVLQDHCRGDSQQKALRG